MRHELLAILLGSILVGLAAVGITSIVRALSPEKWLVRKPVGCDLCMSTWSVLTLVVLLYVATNEDWWPTLFPAITISVLILDRLHREPATEPPVPPELPR